MARYVCHKCGGRDPFCLLCWGNRYYKPAAAKPKEELPATLKEAGLPQPADAAETEPTDV